MPGQGDGLERAGSQAEDATQGSQYAQAKYHLTDPFTLLRQAEEPGGPPQSIHNYRRRRSEAASQGTGEEQVD